MATFTHQWYQWLKGTRGDRLDRLFNDAFVRQRYNELDAAKLVRFLYKTENNNVTGNNSERQRDAEK